MRIATQAALAACRLDLGLSDDSSRGSYTDVNGYGPYTNWWQNSLSREMYGPNAPQNVGQVRTDGFHGGGSTPGDRPGSGPGGGKIATGATGQPTTPPSTPPVGGGGAGQGEGGGMHAAGMTTGGADGGGYQPMTNDISASPEGRAFIAQWRQGVQSGQIPGDTVPAIGPDGQPTVIPRSQAPWATGAAGAAPGSGYGVGGPSGLGYHGSYGAGGGPTMAANGATMAQGAQSASDTGAGGFSIGTQSAQTSGDPGRMPVTPVTKPAANPVNKGVMPPSGSIHPVIPNPYPGPNPGGNPGGGPPVTGTDPNAGNITQWGQGGASGNRALAGGQLYDVFSQALAHPELDATTSNALRQEGMNAARSSFAGAQGQLARHVASTGNSAGFAAGQSALGRAMGQTLGQQGRQNILDEEQLKRQREQWAGSGLSSLYAGETGYMGNLLGQAGGLAKIPLIRSGVKTGDTSGFNAGLHLTTGGG